MSCCVDNGPEGWVSYRTLVDMDCPARACLLEVPCGDLIPMAGADSRLLVRIGMQIQGSRVLASQDSHISTMTAHGCGNFGWKELKIPRMRP